MILLDPQWKYFTAEETRKPDYLAKRFAQIRRQLNEQAVAQKKADEEVLLKVRKLSKGWRADTTCDLTNVDGKLNNEHPITSHRAN